MFKAIKKQLLQEAPKLSPSEIRGRVYPEVLVTDMAPEGLKAAVGPDRVAYLVGTEPLQIEIPNVKGIYEVNPCDIIFEATGGYEKAFKAAMKKYGIRTLSDLDTPEEKKGFYDFIDRVWHSKEEKDKGEKKGSDKDEMVPIDPDSYDEDSMEEELPLYSDHARKHKEEDAVMPSEDDDEDKNEIIVKKKLGSYGVVKGDPKGEGEVVFKGSANKARSIAKALKRKGVQVYFINSHRAKVGQRVYYKKDHGFKLEVSPPARRHQAHGIKKDIAKGEIPKTYVDKKTGKRKKTNAFALAWAQYDKYGKPSSGPDKGSKTMKREPKK